MKVGDPAQLLLCDGMHGTCLVDPERWGESWNLERGVFHVGLFGTQRGFSWRIIPFIY